MKQQCEHCGEMKSERDFKGDPEVCDDCLQGMHEEAVSYCQKVDMTIPKGGVKRFNFDVNTPRVPNARDKK